MIEAIFASGYAVLGCLGLVMAVILFVVVVVVRNSK